MRKLVSLATFVALVIAGVYAYGQADMKQASGAPNPAAAAQKLGVDPNGYVKLDEERLQFARIIGRDVVCLCGTCPREPVSDCQCPWAAMGRRTIQGALAKGMTREQIVAGFRAAYDEKVLAMVPEDGFAQTAWILPYTAVVIMGIVFVIVGIRFKRRRDAGLAGGPPPESGPATGPEDSRAALARELDEMD